MAHRARAIREALFLCDLLDLCRDDRGSPGRCLACVDRDLNRVVLGYALTGIRFANCVFVAGPLFTTRLVSLSSLEERSFGDSNCGRFWFFHIRFQFCFVRVKIVVQWLPKLVVFGWRETLSMPRGHVPNCARRMYVRIICLLRVSPILPR